MDTAGWRGNPSQLETDVAERRGTWTSWRVVATDHSCLCVMMMMMILNAEVFPVGRPMPNAKYAEDTSNHSWFIMTWRFSIRHAVIRCNLQQNANEGCNSCASLAGLVLSFIAAACCSCNNFKFYCKLYCMFYCSCDPSLTNKQTNNPMNEVIINFPTIRKDERIMHIYPSLMQWHQINTK